MLTASYVVGAVVDAGAAIGMASPDRFGAALLIWAGFDPTARRGVLLITVVPVIAGLMLHDAYGVRRGELQPGPVWAVRALQLALVALFLSAYFLG